MQMVHGESFPPGDRRTEEGLNAEAERMQEFEFQLVTVSHAFQRWALQCMGACGIKELNITDILVLHHVNHRARGKKLADIGFILNLEDTYVASYSLKKLQNLGLVRAERRGKETLYSTTDRGHALCGRYRDMRERLLVLEIGNTGVHGHDLSAIAQFLRVLSGMYDQAARAATTM